ncbi:MAG: hypothetical protein KDD84_09700, partial [Caldilineaceae bacterium]|nr:hypothetical protein [Caldilineaceae bacterium]
FQVAEDGAFSAPSVNVVISNTIYTAELTTTVEISRTYYARSRSIQVDGSQSDWSAPVAVTVIPMPPEAAATSAGKVLGVTPQLQHKDTRMLCLDGDPEFGIYRWDSAHEIDGDLIVGDASPVRGSPHDDWYCTRASISMIADYHGSKLSQDRISYYAYGGGVPEGDLGHGIGLWPNQGCTQGGGKNVMWWAMNDATGVCARGKPSFAAVKSWIDAGRPALFVENNDAHSVVMAGYWEFNWFFFSWQFAYRVDPWTNSGGWIWYNSWNVSEYHVPPANVNPRQDEASLFTDADADGIVDFDEQNRFATSPNDNDTDNDCVNDKQDIRGYVFNHLGQYQKRWPDWDGDGLRKEVDRDNDNGGWLDGDEDKNWNGLSVDAAGRRDGVDTSNFSWWDDRPGPCSPSPTPTRTPTSTYTPTPTYTPTRTPPPPTSTWTPTRTPTRTPTYTPSATPTATSTATATPSTTATTTATATATQTATETATGTATATTTATATGTITATATLTATATITATETAIATPTPTTTTTATATPTGSPTATVTVTAEATKEPPVITGVSGTFQEDAENPGRIAIQIHVIDDTLDQQVHDVEIYFDLQDPPWQGVEPIQAPPGWQAQPITSTTPTGGEQIVGIWFVTEDAPLVTCQPVGFEIFVSPPEALGNFIKIYLTDKEHNVIGQIGAQRAANAEGSTSAFGPNGLAAWLTHEVAAACP